MFAGAREAAGTGRDTVEGTTVGAVLAGARQRYGDAFSGVLAASRVWVNGEPAGADVEVGEDDEVAILPPVSGGALAQAPVSDGDLAQGSPGPGTSQ